jgi:cobalt-zinc-cadmium efflux system protein
MVTDSAALGLALLAQSIAKWHPSEKYTFGFGRVEALAAFVNALMLLAMVSWIGWEAAQRLATPQPVQGATVFIVASIGLTVNLIIAWLLSHDKDSLNTKAAMVNVLGDMLGSIGALAAGVVIYFTGWLRIDPLLSIFVCMLILRSAVGILGESYHFLMKGVPRHIDYLQVGTDLSAVKGVLSVHDLHIWEMSPGQPALIGHIEIRDLQEWPKVLRTVKAMLLTKHGIDHVTLQAELPKMVRGE